MSFIAKLSVDGEEMNVLYCNFRFSQVIDPTGRPSSIPKGGTVNLTIESTGKVDLFDWMISTTQRKNGTVTFFRRDTMSKLKTLEFTDAHCVDYAETYQHEGAFPMQINILLSAKELKLNGSAFRNNWPE
ncbi:MAG: type VI secretion system tube protein TssD [Flavihumibacter sp.]